MAEIFEAIPTDRLNYAAEESIGSQLVEKGGHIGDIYTQTLEREEILDTYVWQSRELKEEKRLSNTTTTTQSPEEGETRAVYC